MSKSKPHEPAPECLDSAHPRLGEPSYSDEVVEDATRLFRALGDVSRLRTLQRLVGCEACVTQLAEASQESVSTVSHRLRLMRNEGLVQRRRQGRHIYYSLADDHVVELLRNALDHVARNCAQTLKDQETESP